MRAGYCRCGSPPGVGVGVGVSVSVGCRVAVSCALQIGNVWGGGGEE